MSCRTFLNPKTCGFGKCAAIFAAKKSRQLKREENEGKAKFGARLQQHHYTTFKDIFHSQENYLQGEVKEFNKHFKALQQTLNKWSPRKKHEKEQFLEQFSVENWLALSNATKKEHTLFDCKGCHQNFTKAQSLFPLKSLRLKAKAKENPFVIAQTLEKDLNKQLPSKTVVKQTARCLYESINNAFKSVSGGVTFAEALTKVPETNLKWKQTKCEAKKARRNILIESKKNTEAKWKETSLARYMSCKKLSLLKCTICLFDKPVHYLL